MTDSRLQGLHNPKDPLVLCNAYDGETTRIVIRHGGAKALAISSHTVAVVRDKSDEKLTPEIFVMAMKDIISIIDANSGGSIIPLSVDMRDGSSLNQ